MPKITASNVSVETDSYKATHGRAPRGTGFWFFGIGNGITYQETDFYGSFTEARKAARKWAAARGSYRVTVLT